MNHYQKYGKKWRANDQLKAMFYNLKYYAKKRGIPFTLSIEQYVDLPRPDRCPLTGIEIDYTPHKGKTIDASPTLDRIDNEGGYELANVQIVSYMGNRAKSNLTIGQLKHFADYILAL